MRFATPAAVLAAFAAGLAVAPGLHALQDLLPEARAQAAPLAPMMVDLAALQHADLPRTSNPDMNARPLVVTDNATIGIQSGNAPKHLHARSDEIQYIIEGSGSMWLGSERREFKPGTLIVIPKGTAHSGSIVSSGPVKAIAIKIPPQGAGDVVLLN